MHDCLVPVTTWCAGMFKCVRDDGKPPPRAPADMRHVLLVLPFLLHDLLRPEFEAHNRQNPQADHVVDPSAELIGVVLTLLTWYRLVRRRSPAKDEVDLKRVTCLGHRYQVKSNSFLPFHS